MQYSAPEACYIETQSWFVPGLLDNKKGEEEAKMAGIFFLPPFCLTNPVLICAKFVRQKKGKKMPTFIKRKVSSSSCPFLSHEPGTDLCRVC
jgi:hypothetical protein